MLIQRLPLLLICLVFFSPANVLALDTGKKNQTIKPVVNAELRSLLLDAINDTTSFEDKYAAEVWYTDMSRRMSRYVKDPEERLKILKIVHQESTKAGLKPELVLSVMHVESLFDRYAISVVGARGLMQVMPFWLKELKKPNGNLFDIQTNIRMGCTILKYYLDKEKGNLYRGLGRYNGSLGKNKYPDKVVKAMQRYWFKQ